MMCPDCGGGVSSALIYGLRLEMPVPCVICWACGWQTPAVYRRSRAERNADQCNATAACSGCGTTVTASKPTLLRAYCHDCYRLQRERPLSAAAVQGRVRRMP